MKKNVFTPPFSEISEVEVSGNQWVIIDKLFGPQCSSRIRVQHDIAKCEWVVEEENFNDSPPTWHERARFNAQEFYDDKYLPEDERGLRR